MSKLKSPMELRFRRIRSRPHICGYCAYRTFDDTGTTVCARDPGNISWDTGDMEEYWRTCDGWRDALSAVKLPKVQIGPDGEYQ